jgi:hypothetical protein
LLSLLVIGGLDASRMRCLALGSRGLPARGADPAKPIWVRKGRHACYRYTLYSSTWSSRW